MGKMKGLNMFLTVLLFVSLLFHPMATVGVANNSNGQGNGGQPGNDSGNSANTHLESLRFYNDVIVLDFKKNTNNYTSTVDYEIRSVKVIPEAAHTGSTVTVNGKEVVYNSVSEEIPLVVGVNTIEVTVTAQNGSKTNDYKVTITRNQSSNAYLSSLLFNNADVLNFNKDTFTYTKTVGYDVDSLTLVPTAVHEDSTIKVIGTVVSSGEESQTIELNVGVNEVVIDVNSQDGTSTKKYILNVEREKSSNAYLSNLEVSGKHLSFDKDELSYDLQVGNEIESVTLTPTTAHAAATVVINVNGQVVESETINLNSGENNINIIVTAQNGDTKTYTVTITRLKDEVHATPEIQDNKATVKDEDVNIIDNKGKLVVDLTGQHETVETVNLTSEQLLLLVEREISLEIVKEDVQIKVPVKNFQNTGELLISLVRQGQDIPVSDKSLSAIYKFTILLDGNEVNLFDYEVELVFPITELGHENVEEFKVYYFNPVNVEWELIGGRYVDGNIIASTNHFSIFGVFHPSVFVTEDEEEADPTVPGDVEDEEVVEDEETKTPENVEEEVDPTVPGNVEDEEEADPTVPGNVENEEDAAPAVPGTEADEKQSEVGSEEETVTKEESETETKTEESKEKSTTENKLPNTATNLYNSILFGLAFIVAGLMVVIFRRKSIQA